MAVLHNVLVGRVRIGQPQRGHPSQQDTCQPPLCGAPSTRGGRPGNSGERGTGVECLSTESGESWSQRAWKGSSSLGSFIAVGFI